jgi:hypothetical protein
MAISQAITVSFKQDLMSPGGNLEAQTLKCALYDNTATLNQNTTAYITANEISDSATISAQAALIYNANNSNSSIAVLDFGGVKTSTNGTFELQFPNADATNGLIRIA